MLEVAAIMVLRPRPQGKVAEQVSAAGSKVKCHPVLLLKEAQKTESQSEVHQPVEEQN